MSSNDVDTSTIPGTLAVVDIVWLTEQEERAWRALQFMQMRLEAAIARQLAAESSLSYPDYLVLVALTDSGAGRLRSFELGRLLGWEKSRLSHQVARMTERGLVEKQVCESDRRGAYVAVTEKGREEIAAAAPGHVRTVRELFVDVLTPHELDVVTAAAERVLVRMREDGRG